MSGDPFFAQVAEDTLRYVERDLRSPEGAFYSAEDADSVSHTRAAEPGAHATEGAFYIWSRDEIVEAIGPDSRVWEMRFGVLPGGNAPFDPHDEFGANNLLYTAKTIATIVEETGMTPPAVGAALARGRQRLFDTRARRPRPLLDDKVLTAWNGLMIAACARAARALAPSGALGEGMAGTGAHHLAVAQRCAAFVHDHLWERESGRLRRRFAAGESGIDAFAEDYAYLAWGLIELFQADGDPRVAHMGHGAARVARSAVRRTGRSGVVCDHWGRPVGVAAAGRGIRRRGALGNLGRSHEPVDARAAHR